MATTKYRTIRETDESPRTFRATEIDGKVYAYERQGATYAIFTLDSLELNEHGHLQPECVGYDFPSAAFAKDAIAALAAGRDIQEHAPGHIYSHLAGGGWGGWSRTYRATPVCRTCGRLTSAHDDSIPTVAEAREIAWGHWAKEMNV